MNKKEKTEYVTPEIDLIRFESQDIITASGEWKDDGKLDQDGWDTN